MSPLVTTICRFANRIPGLYVGHMPLVPTDEVRWFDHAAHYELRLWSVSVVVTKPASLRRERVVPERLEGPRVGRSSS